MPPVIQKPAAAGNFGTGRKNRISRITFHHIVGDAAGAIARFQTPGVEVSSTYVIGSDGTIYQCVNDNDTPYTDANSDSNSRSITIEHAGGHSSVPYTEAMYQSSIKLVRALVRKYGITDFKRHRDVSETPTECPGTLDVERIVKTALGVTMTEDGVRFGILAVTGGQPLKDYEKEVAYWTGRDPQEFTKYLYGLSDYYMVDARGKIKDLEKRTVISKEAVLDYVTKNLK